MALPPTPAETLVRARKIATEEGVNYVYSGNLPGVEGESTYCPACRRCVVKRFCFEVEEMLLEGGRCGECGHRIPIITDWKKARKD